jgi:hypothetical protein
MLSGQKITFSSELIKNIEREKQMIGYTSLTVHKKVEVDIDHYKHSLQVSALFGFKNGSRLGWSRKWIFELSHKS